MVITGDLVDATVADLKNAAEPVKDIKTAYGKFFVTGQSSGHAALGNKFITAWCFTLGYFIALICLNLKMLNSSSNFM